MWSYSAAVVYNKMTHTTFRGEDSSMSSGVIVNITGITGTAVLCLWAHFGPISSSFGPRGSKYCPHLSRRFSRYFTRGRRPILPPKHWRIGFIFKRIVDEVEKWMILKYSRHVGAIILCFSELWSYFQKIWAYANMNI